MRFRSASMIGASLVLLILSGCASFGGGGGTERIEKTQTLRVGMVGDYPPMNAQTVDGRLIGIDVDLAGALAAILSVKLELVEMNFADLLDAVEKGDVDLAISGITMTPRRNLQIAFAGPYYLARKTALAKAELIEGVTQLSDIAGQGLRVAALAGGTSQALVERLLPNDPHVFVDGQNEGVDRLVAGKVDVMILDDPAARYALLRHPDAGLAFFEVPYTAEPIGIAISSRDPLLINLVENYLANLENIGLMDTLKNKWFSESDWINYVR